MEWGRCSEYFEFRALLLQNLSSEHKYMYVYLCVRGNIWTLQCSSMTDNTIPSPPLPPPPLPSPSFSPLLYSSLLSISPSPSLPLLSCRPGYTVSQWASTANRRVAVALSLRPSLLLPPLPPVAVPAGRPPQTVPGSVCLPRHQQTGVW